MWSTRREAKRERNIGAALIERLAADLTARFGHGFSVRNVRQMKSFYLAWSILQTPSAKSGRLAIPQTASEEYKLQKTAARFSLPWSLYVRLLAAKDAHSIAFDEAEARTGAGRAP